MPNYKKMYLTLVHEVARTIDNLQSALEKAEAIYMEGGMEMKIAPRREEPDSEAAGPF